MKTAKRIDIQIKPSISKNPVEEAKEHVKEKIPTISELRLIFSEDQAFFQDWILRYFLSRYEASAIVKLQELSANCSAEIKKNENSQFYDQQTVKGYAAFFPKNFSDMLRTCDRIFEKLRSAKHKGNPNPLLERDDIVKIIVFREMKGSLEFIQKNSIPFKELVDKYKDHPFINGNTTLLFYYFIRDGYQANIKLISDTELFLILQKKYSDDSIVFSKSKTNGNDLIRLAILQNPKNPDSVIQQAKESYRLLSTRYEGVTTVLDEYQQEAINTLSMFYPQSAFQKMEQLIHRVELAKTTINQKITPNGRSEIIDQMIQIAVRCDGSTFKKTVEDICRFPRNYICVPPKFNLNQLIYKLFFDFDVISEPNPTIQ
jgi:hypothetical protein